MNPALPFNDLPELPPNQEVETKAVLKKCIDARVALESLRQAADSLPNQNLLIHVIPIMEAQSSSEIENIVTTTDDLFREATAMKTVTNHATKETLNYRKALYEGLEQIKTRPLCTATAEAICSRIKSTQMTVRRVPGTKLANDFTGEVIYTPPEGEDVLREKLANWEKFLHEATHLDPLVRLAIGHYQFEAIHPFTDGNGRSGRILNLLYLVDRGLLTQPILYHSRGIFGRKADYYRLLLRVTAHKEWEPWLIFMLEVIEETSKWTKNKIDGIRNLQDHTERYLHGQHETAFHRGLIDMVFSLPYCRIANVVEAGVLKRQAAAKHLNSLVEAGILEESKVGREKLFIHRKFLDLLCNSSNDFEPYTD